LKRARALLILVCLVACSSFAVAQFKAEAGTESAKATLVHFIELSKRQALRTPEARKILSNEALKWDTPSFGDLGVSPDKMILLDKETSVGRVQWHGQNNYVADLYFYLGFDGTWKIGAVRRLALTGIVEMAYNGLRLKKTLTQEEQDELSNLELVLASDEVLRAWFGRNVSALNRLYELTRSMHTGEYVFLIRQEKSYPKIRQMLKELHLDGLEVQQDGNVQITIGGVTDNTVGFIYSPSNHPPPIDPSSYIWVEGVANKWFLFRTT